MLPLASYWDKNIFIFRNINHPGWWITGILGPEGVQLPPPNKIQPKEPWDFRWIFASKKKPADLLVGSKGSWRISVLCVLPARPAVIEDEDGDLAMPRSGTPELETDGGRMDPSIAGAADALMWP